MIKRVLISILVLLLVACVVTSLLLIGGVLVISTTPSVSLQLVFGATATPIPSATHTPKPQNTITPSATASVTPETISQPTPLKLSPAENEWLDTLQVQTASLRGLNFRQPLERSLLTPDTLQKQVSEAFLKEEMPAQILRSAQLLTSLGLLEPDFDLAGLYKTLASSPISHYYSPQDKKMYITIGSALDGPQRLAYVREVSYGLLDQHFALQNKLFSPESCFQNTDRCLAQKALLEGDAARIAQAWFFTYSTPQDQKQIEAYAKSGPEVNSASVPAFIQAERRFPSHQGQVFIQALLKRGGNSLVDDAFKNPPVSTEQILHPEKYPDEQPLFVELPDLSNTLGSGWKLTQQNSLGEWMVGQVLSAGQVQAGRLPPEEERQAAAGWAGDTCQLYENTESQKALILWSVWDSPEESQAFFQALSRHIEGLFGEAKPIDKNQNMWENTSQGSVLIQQEGQNTLWLIAPDRAQLQKLLSEIPGLKK
jgi:hypothetical protein